MDMGCDSCQVVTINSTACHETGCPNSWINPATGKAYLVRCWECGFDFQPDDKDNTGKYAVCLGCRQDLSEAGEYELDE